MLEAPRPSAIVAREFELERYSPAPGNTLLTECWELTSFEHVPNWMSRVADELARIRAYLDRLSSSTDQLRRAREEAVAARAAQSFFKRTFTSDPVEPAIARLQVEASTARETLTALVARLQQAVQRTPCSPDERAAMLAELRQTKKDLVLQKQQINQGLRDVRSGARHQAAEASLGLLLASGKTRRFANVGIRAAKELALRPKEQARAELEAQLAVVDLNINRLEKLQ